jgi:hypothetical protein
MFITFLTYPRHKSFILKNAIFANLWLLIICSSHLGVLMADSIQTPPSTKPAVQTAPVVMTPLNEYVDNLEKEKGLDASKKFLETMKIDVNEIKNPKLFVASAYDKGSDNREIIIGTLASNTPNQENAFDERTRAFTKGNEVYLDFANVKSEPHNERITAFVSNKDNKETAKIAPESEKNLIRELHYANVKQAAAGELKGVKLANAAGAAVDPTLQGALRILQTGMGIGAKS